MVIDNFLDDPDRVRAHALKLDLVKYRQQCLESDL